MRDTVYMDELKGKIIKYDREIKDLKFRYQTVFKDIERSGDYKTTGRFIR